MAEEFTPNTFTNPESETAFVTSLNDNFAVLATLLADCLSRSGVSPNSMEAVLDMNGFEIINLPKPVNSTDVVRLEDLQNGGLPFIVFGTGVPTAPGFTSQVYIDKSTWNVYEYNGTAWVFEGNIQGPSGPGTGDMLNADNLAHLTNFATARANLGLAIGSNVEAWSATLDLLSALSTTSFGRSLLTLSNSAALQALLTLGGAALLNVGTGASTVAAGNDSRFYNFTPNVQNANYTFQLSDRGGLVLANTVTAYAWTLPPSASFGVGDAINVRASVGAGTITLTRGAGVTLTLGGGSTNKDWALAAGGAATLINEGLNTWYILGVGVS